MTPGRPLFLPTARQTNWLLIVAFLALGQAMYLRYHVMENSTVSLACRGGLRTWLCDAFRLVNPFVSVSGFRRRRAGGGAASSAAPIDRLGDGGVSRGRSRRGVAQCRSVGACSRTAYPEPGAAGAEDRVKISMAASASRRGAEPDRLPVGKSFVEKNVDGGRGEHCAGQRFGRATYAAGRLHRCDDDQKRELSPRSAVQTVCRGSADRRRDRAPLRAPTASSDQRSAKQPIKRIAALTGAMQKCGKAWQRPPGTACRRADGRRRRGNSSESDRTEANCRR